LFQILSLALLRGSNFSEASWKKRFCVSHVGPKSNDSSNSAVRCGIILSGGREIVYRRRADYLPKQYLNFIEDALYYITPSIALKR